MPEYAEMKFIGLDELMSAINRSPHRVIKEAKRFLTRGMAVYKRGIINNPWKLGSSGGGAPVFTGNLRDTHVTRITGFQASIGPNSRTSPYARFVHDGTRFVKARPWLDYVKGRSDGQIVYLYNEMLDNIVGDLKS